MQTPDMLRYTKIPLNNGSGAMPAVGFGTLIPDPVATKQAMKTALEVGFRHFDCAERYRNEEAIGEAMQEVFKAGAIRREDAGAQHLGPAEYCVDGSPQFVRRVREELPQPLLGGGTRIERNLDPDQHGVERRATVLRGAQGALVQLIRNAVAHGIEPDAERWHRAWSSSMSFLWRA